MMVNVREIQRVLSDTRDVLAEEPIVNEINSDEGIFIGDLHGDMEAFEKINDYIQDVDCPSIFLGDYVDRGAYSIEIMKSLFEMKVKDPNRVILLRGNHETPLANSRYGFKEDVRRKFPSNSHEIYQKFNETFAELPIAATLDDGRVIGLHGGIPRNTESLVTLKELPKGIVEPHRIDRLFQTLWNDPRESIEGFGRSMRGPGIYTFGRNAFDKFMKNSNAELMVRAHLAFPSGVRYYFNKRLISLFSTLSYKGRQIEGKVLHYKAGKPLLRDISEF
ncbi:MAG: hypothetical protein GWN31_01100 [Candidatus Thorarchaeota archaeon]|nr:hypothetical protein [Candidatus Thorarchaeota archaeon]NIW12542.1 hypothetical protein [Candidatus Thorarchaeota archaeon]